MTHEEALQADLVGEYVRDQLSSAVRAAFEQHFFECDACFVAIESEGRLRAGVRRLAAIGALTDPAPGEGVVTPSAPSRVRVLAPWLIVAASLVLAVGTWQSAHARARELQTRVHVAETKSADLAGALKAAREDASAAASRIRGAAEANVPLVILQTTRGNRVSELIVPATAKRFLVWLEDPPALGQGAARLVLAPVGGSALAVVDGLRPNKQGAIVASFPSDLTPAGPYTLRLMAHDRLQAEYSLSLVSRP